MYATLQNMEYLVLDFLFIYIYILTRLSDYYYLSNYCLTITV